MYQKVTTDLNFVEREKNVDAKKFKRGEYKCIKKSLQI